MAKCNAPPDLRAVDAPAPKRARVRALRALRSVPTLKEWCAQLQLSRPAQLRWLTVKRAAHLLGVRGETMRSMCAAGDVRARRVGPKLFRVWFDGEGLPGEPGCPVDAPGLLRNVMAEIGDAAAQCDTHPETVRKLCIAGLVRARKVGGRIWRVWLDGDGLMQPTAAAAHY